jgi:hypothetical protein
VIGGSPTSLNPGTRLAPAPTETVARKQAFVKRAEALGDDRPSRICSAGGGASSDAPRHLFAERERHRSFSKLGKKIP